MPDSTTLEQLLSHWDQLRAEGKQTEANALCNLHPELRKRVSGVLAMDAALERIAATPTLLPEATGGSGDSAAEAAPVVFPGYEILTELGRGGMGVVYKARHLELNRVVALKMILAGGHAGPDELARFRTEAEAIARLQHPGIVQIYETGVHNGLPYFALEFVEGGSLDRKLNGTPLPPNAAARLTALLAQAMQSAHEKGILHRDLKPANILLMPTKEGAVPLDQRAAGFTPPEPWHTISQRSAILVWRRNWKPNNPPLTPLRKGGELSRSPFKRGEEQVAPPSRGDAARSSPPSRGDAAHFSPPSEGGAGGVATRGLTATGAVMGTPSYMAPEQAGGKNKEITPLTDVYALGAILYELLTGRPPFRAATALDTLLQVVADEPVPPRQLNPKTPRDLETICLKCLQKEPGKRYRSAADLAADLGRFLENEPIQARPVGLFERSWRWCHRNRITAALLSITASSVLGGLVSTTVFTLRAEAAARAATTALEERDAASRREKAVARLYCRYVEEHPGLGKLSREERIQAFMRSEHISETEMRNAFHPPQEAGAKKLESAAPGMFGD